MKKFLFLFIALFSLSIPLSVNAIDDPGFFNNCEFIPEKAYAVQNNGSHNNGTSFTSITREDTDNLFTNNAYSIGDLNYRAVKLEDVIFDSDYGSTIQFEFFSYNDKWGENGIYWNTQSNYEGYVMLGSLNKSKFDFRHTYNNLDTSVGILPINYDYGVSPSDYNSYVNQHTFYYKNNNFQISILHFRFELKGKNAQNKLVLNITSDKNISEDIFILGFNLKSSAKTTTGLGTEGWTDVPLDTFNIFREGFDNECYIGSLPDDIASPDLAIECDGVIDCTIKKVESTFSKWIDGLLSFLSKLFIPDSEKMSNIATDFMDWFEEKLGFLGQPITFTINFLNRFLNLTDTGHYVIHWSDIKVPLFDYVIIQSGEIDLASFLQNPIINTIHNVTFVIINGGIGIAFLMLCGKKLDDIFGQSHDNTGETLIEHEGYSINNETGEVKETHTISKRRKLTKKRV